MVISPKVAAVTAAVMIAAACSGSDDTGEQGSSDPDNGTGTDSTEIEVSEPAKRSVTRVLVTGADSESLEEIHTVLVDYALLDEALEEIVVLGSSCEGINDDLFVCQSEAESLTPTPGRQALVVLDGDLANAAEVAAMLHMRPAVFVAGEPIGEGATALAGVSSTITFVPGGLSELVSDPVAVFLIGVRDELGAFTPLESVDAAVGGMSSAHHFLDTRLETMIDHEPDDEPDDVVVPEPDVRWVIELPDPIGGLGVHERAVVVDNIVAFLGNDGITRGLDTNTGDVLWTKQINDNPRLLNESFVDVAGDTLLVSAQAASPGSPEMPAHSLWALDIRTGAEIWTVSVPAGGLVGHPATDGERVFVWLSEDASEGSDASIRALDLGDGTEIWRVEGQMSAGPPRVAAGEVWTGSRDGVVLGLDAATGTELVRYEEVGLGTNGIAARPAVAGDKVFFGNDSGAFSAIDRATGELVWNFPTESTDLPSSPVVTDDTVIFGSFDGGIYALDIADGVLRWRHDAGEGTVFLSSAVVADNVAYIADLFQPSSILALDVATGQPIWELPIGDLVSASPYIDGDTLYIQTPGQFWAIAL